MTQGNWRLGVYVDEKTLIGGVGVSAGNIIAGNTSYGIKVAGGDGTIIQGNTIGADQSGILPLSNYVGVDVSGGANT